MTPVEVALVQSSFRRIRPIGDRVTALFYERLFVLDPASRTLFQVALNGHGRQWFSMLAPVVDSLDDLDSLLPTVRAFGGRQTHCGAIEEHYASIGAALMWALSKCLGSEFTPAVARAWSSAYSLLAIEVIDGQREARTAVAA